ncbi:universal stress protein [Williamsia sp. Leaf354]|jgi:nucleotide-binding universal stress UspA family protein|uniref:Universal stress protein n=1 Tax=Williamsia herbipolensis TaxID=1603258 RepID=A0AAU4K4Q8_9NOCA|nr:MULTISPECIES: universal stress protein [Williamsia]KQR97748.1 universal stress protein [Williamsia sp. Leaf354]MCX6471783.1 universal stress protein [Mycobacteriales bacterium]
MSAYQTVVVGTDGSESSMKAVERAGGIAGDRAKLVIACAFFPHENKDVNTMSDVLKDEAYQVHGSSPTEEILRTARERAVKAGAATANISTRPVKGAPVDALLQLVGDTKADLLVVGNKGLNSIAGRLLGSVPADVARKSACDVLIVHTV